MSYYTLHIIVFNDSSNIMIVKSTNFFLKKRPFKIAFQIKSIYFIIQHVISKSHAKIYIVVDNKNELIHFLNRKTVVKVFKLSFVNLLIF